MTTLDKVVYIESSNEVDQLVATALNYVGK